LIVLGYKAVFYQILVKHETLKLFFLPGRFKALIPINCTSYLVLVFRLDSKTNTLYFLEINSNCSVFYDETDVCCADLILSRHENTSGHEHFLRLILQNALDCQKAKARQVKISFSPDRGFHLVALRDFVPNQLIYTEDQFQTGLVSRKFVTQLEPVSREIYTKYETVDSIKFVFEISSF